jgi:hypothetical protein
MLSYEQIEILTYILLIVCGIYYQKKDNILPLILAFSFFSSGLSRFNAVAVKRTVGYVRVAGWDIFDMNDKLALECLNLFYLGTVLFIMSFMYFKSVYSRAQKEKIDSKELFKKFISKNRVFILFIVVFYFIIYLGKSALSVISFSYGFYSPFGAIGVIICLFFFVQTFDKIGYVFIAILVVGIMLFVANMVLSAYVRFSLIGWVIPIGIAILSRVKSSLRLIMVVIGGAVILVGFSFLGVLRNAKDMTTSELLTLSVERLLVSEDSNMLDGFMMVHQVVPDLIDYQLGLNHIEIITRPIPRSVWPNKPVGGYANKLNLNDEYGESFGIGISESMYGTFYMEGGIIGIIVFCWLYGMFLAKVVTGFEKYHGMLGATLLGCIYAALVAWFRGGDFAGIFALLVLSYWPVFVFMRRYNAFLKREKLIEKQNLQYSLAQKEGVLVNDVVVPMHPLLKSFS